MQINSNNIVRDLIISDIIGYSDTYIEHINNHLSKIFSDLKQTTQFNGDILYSRDNDKILVLDRNVNNHRIWIDRMIFAKITSIFQCFDMNILVYSLARYLNIYIKNHHKIYFFDINDSVYKLFIIK